MSNKKDQIMKIFSIIIILVLFIIIIYLLLTREEKKLTPTGNVDIFEIICNHNCDYEFDDSKPVFGEEEQEDLIDITDNNISWQSTNELNIFTNPMFEMENKIAPESTNFYQFVIKNNTNYKVKYDIEFKEKNDFKINMKYRLIKNEEYVAGNEENWVTFAELNLSDFYLSAKESETYYLEWKWFSSDNDTEIGEKGYANYSLSINIEAVQV